MVTATTLERIARITITTACFLSLLVANKGLSLHDNKSTNIRISRSISLNTKRNSYQLSVISRPKEVWHHNDELCSMEVDLLEQDDSREDESQANSSGCTSELKSNPYVGYHS